MTTPSWRVAAPWNAVPSFTGACLPPAVLQLSAALPGRVGQQSGQAGHPLPASALAAQPLSASTLTCQTPTVPICGLEGVRTALPNDAGTRLETPQRFR